jgi:hypothetical protein
MKNKIQLDRPITSEVMDIIKWAWNYVGTDTYLHASMPAIGNHTSTSTREYLVHLYPRKGGRVYQLLFTNPYDSRAKFEVLLEEGTAPLTGGFPKALIRLSEDILTQYINLASTRIKDAQSRGELPGMVDGSFLEGM